MEPDALCDQAQVARLLGYEHEIDIDGLDEDDQHHMDLRRALFLGVGELIEEARAAGVGNPVVVIREAVDCGRLEARAELDRKQSTGPARDYILDGPDDRPPLDDVPPPSDEDAPPGVAGGGWRDLLYSEILKDGTRKVRSCGPNALLFMRHHPGLAGRIGLNERSVEPVWLQPPPWGGVTRPVRETDADELALWITGKEHLVMSREHWWHAIVTEAERHPFDQVRSWLESLEWDGQERMSWLLSHRCAADPSPFVVAAGRAWMISAVARTFDPGCQADHMLVLEGEQGVGKTTTIRELAGPEWYAEISVSDAKDSIMSVHGPWIVEWAELAGISKKDAETVKAFVSRRVDWVRLPYGRRHVNIPRRCVFAGSTNEGTWQTDPTGGRRYWPVKVERCDISGIHADREQLWAEAVSAYRAGGRWWLEGSAAEEAREQQEARYEGDPWEERISDAVSTGSLQLRERVTSAELLQMLDVPSASQGPGTGRRISRIMKRLGWEPSRWREKGGAIPRGYLRPTPVDETASEATAKVRRLRGL